MTSDNMILMSIVKIVPHIQSTHFKFFWKGEEGGGWRLNDDCSFEKLLTYLTRHLSFYSIAILRYANLTNLLHEFIAIKIEEFIAFKNLIEICEFIAIKIWELMT